jgi:hypothetical protein
MIALWLPPEMARCIAGSGVTLLICASVSQPVAFTTKQPDSAAWWRIAASIWLEKVGPTIEPGKWLQWISSCRAISA